MSDPRPPESIAATYTIRGLFVFIAIIASCCGGLVCVRDAIRSQDPRGFVTKREELPYPWQDTLDDALRADVQFKNAEYYRLTGGFGGDQFAIRFDAAPELLAFLIQRHGFQLQKAPTWHLQRFWGDLPEQWKTQAAMKNYDFYLSSAWVNGDEGDRYVMVYDKAAHKIYIWYSFNF